MNNKDENKILKDFTHRLEAARRIIDSLKAHQVASRSLTDTSLGTFEKMIQMERLIELRTKEVIRSQEEIEQANANLEKLVIERTTRLSQLNRDLRVINEIGWIVSNSLDLQQILDDAMKKLLEITGLKGGGYFLVDDERGEIYTAGGMNLSGKFIQRTKKAKIGKGISGTVAQSGNTMLVSDLQKTNLLSEDMKKINRQDGIQGQISIPLKRKDHVIGVMNFIWGVGQDIETKDIPLLETVGYQIGVAVENAILFQETRQRLTELEALIKTSALISANLDRKTLLDTIVAEAQKVFKVDAVSIMTLDKSDNYYHIETATGLSEEYIKHQRIPMKVAISALNANIPLFTYDLRETPFGDKKLIEKEQIVSNLAAPLILDELLGILNLYSKGYHRRFSKHEISLTRALADQVTIALDNSRKFEAVVRSGKEQKFLNEIGQLIVSSLDLDKTLSSILDNIPKLFPSFSCAIMLLNDEGNELRVKAAKGKAHEIRDSLRVPLDKSIAGYVIKSGKALIVPDVDKNPMYYRGFDEVKSEICVPLIYKGKTIGIIDIECDYENAFDTRHKELLTSLGNMAAIAIQNAKSYEESERWATHLQSLHKLGQDLNKTLNMSEIAEKVVQELVRVMDSDDCRIYIIDSNKNELKPLAQWSKVEDYQFDDIEVLKLKVGEGITGNVALTGKAELIHDANMHPKGITISGTDDVDESMMLAPMKFEDRVKGVISLSKLGLNQFSPDQLRLLTIIADETAIALENARLYQEKMNQLSEIQRLKDFNEAIVEGLEEGILIEDDRGYITFVNPKLEKISGYKSRELIGKHWSNLYAEEFRSQIEVETKKRSAGIASRYEAAIVNIDKKSIPVFISARPIFNQGKLVSVLSAISDISELKDIEMRMVRNARLRALGEMSGGVAHDFNNVLGAILGRVQLLLKSNPNPRFTDGLKIIETAALDGAETVKRIQDFTRTRTGDKFVPVDINEIVKDAVSMTRGKWKEEADASGILIKMETDLQSLPGTLGNPGELREVLTNLIFNAVDALPNGGIIRISTQVEGDKILLIVKDNGGGMDENVLVKIFDPFFSTKGVKGTGLGLSVSYGIINRHSGEITVNSSPGKGASFIIRLPVVEVDAPSEPEKEEILTPSDSFRVVVIDDEEALRNLLRDLLTLGGHQVWTAEDGNTGLELVAELNPDIVFTDLGMPAISGWEVVEGVKTSYPDTPVVMVTGWGEQIKKEKIVKSGVDAIVAKPFKIEEIQKVIYELVIGGKL